ncbi:sesquipedalian-1 isoform X3 [Eurosta solidaginis]|uniref:sesquipedalian-1 isoform X3 n=1 Tax=Eurosta solidaginis TaxID=178769 RepID=UPI003530C2C5
MKINEKNLCVFATTPPYDCEGFLNKRGEVNKAFLRRYFVLKGNLLFYFEKRGEKEPLGLIIVEGCTIELSEESEQYCFEIAFNGNRTYVLSADTQESMETWMKALTCAGYEYKKFVVAELQRQLVEIECSRNSSALERSPLPPSRSCRNDTCRQKPFQQHWSNTAKVFIAPSSGFQKKNEHAFDELHEKFRRIVMIDVIEYRYQQQLNCQPLIEL